MMGFPPRNYMQQIESYLFTNRMVFSNAEGRISQQDKENCVEDKTRLDLLRSGYFLSSCDIT